MSENSQRRSVVVGLFVLIGMAILVAGILLIGNLNRSLQNRIKIVVYCDDVNGLQKGNFIWFSGVRIGTIKSARIKGPTDVEVIMDIDAKVRQYISKDSKVKLGSDGFIGNRILIIFGGTRDGASVQEGDTLHFEKTLSAEEMINTLQQNNENLKSITGDFKIISKKIAEGEGSLGKLITDNSLYTNINSASASLRDASVKAQQMISSLADFSSGLKKKGTLAHELTADTVIFSSLRSSVTRLKEITDTANVVISSLKKAESNPKTPVGALLHDETTGTELKETIKNLRISTERLNVDLEALQHSFLLRGYFKHKKDEPKP
jgi:phospholipid/cholesterol/gamma-HCH transport system substrate-binding protein